MLENLNKLANVFATAFNQVHEAGYTIDETTQTGVTFFEGGTPITAGNIKVTDAVRNNSSLIAASSKVNEEGNGKWAAELAKLQSVALSNGGFSITVDGNTTDFSNAPTLNGATYQSFYEGLVGKLGVDGQEAKRLQYNTETIRLTVQNNRASISSVSLDEEMTNLITFQQAYNANARMITVIDETLDKIINGLGRVGL